MSWTIGLAYLRAVIWPAVLVAMLLYFHRPVRAVLKGLADKMKDLKAVKVPGGGLDYYEDKFIQVREEAASLPSVTAPPTEAVQGDIIGIDVENIGGVHVPSHKDAARFRQWQGRAMIVPVDLAELARNSPQTTIVVAWQQLDAVIRMLFKELNPDPPLGDTPGILGQLNSVISELRDSSILDGAASVVILRVIMNLIELRDVENRTPTKLEAYEYAVSADQVAGTLRQGVALMQMKAANVSAKVE
jgi:hypothetical protein